MGRTSGGSGGGGASVGNNWLCFYAAAAVTLTTSGEIVTWTALANNGTVGFSLNADTETFDCTATGIYIVFLTSQVSYTKGSSDPGGTVELGLVATVEAASLASAATLGESVSVSPNSSFPSSAITLPLALTTPPLEFASGDSFQVSGLRLSTPASTGTWKAPATNTLLSICQIG